MYLSLKDVAKKKLAVGGEEWLSLCTVNITPLSSSSFSCYLEKREQCHMVASLSNVPLN